MDRDTGPGLMTSHGEPQELAPRAACTHRLVGSLPEDGQHVDRTDRRRQEAGDGLDVMEQFGNVLHDGDPRDAHAHQHDHTQPGIQGNTEIYTEQLRDMPTSTITHNMSYRAI